MQNIKHGKRESLNCFRKIAIGCWQHPNDPSTYSSLDLSVESARAFMDRSAGERPATVTHFVAKILGHCFEKYPHLNLVLLRNNLYKREEVNIFITTLLKRQGGTDLSGFVIPNINGMSLSEVTEMASQKTELLRRNGDPEILELQRQIGRVPPFLLKPFFAFANFLTASHFLQEG